MKRRVLQLLLFPCLIVSLGLVVSLTGSFSDFREYSNSNTVPDVLLQSGQTGNALRLFEYSSLPNARLEKFSAGLPPAEMPSSKAVEHIARRSLLPTVSVVIDRSDLLDRSSGILTNPTERGRRWERPVYFSFFQSGELSLATGAGMRVHGGKSRTKENPSFRLYFRQVYGSSTPTTIDFFDARDYRLSSLVLHNDVRISNEKPWHYVNPIAYELVREIGGLTPMTQPVQFYLNGVYQGPFVLTEHINRDYATALFGHDDYTIAEQKPNSKSAPPVEVGRKELYEEFVEWSLSAPAPLDIADASARIDLDNFTDWLIGMVYAGVTDAFQGVALLDHTAPDSRWFLVNWDMDHAFSDLYDQAEHPWEIDNFVGYTGLLTSKNKPLSVLLERLRLESPEFGRHVVERTTAVLNHILTPENVARIVDKYRQVAIQHGIGDLAPFDTIEEFGRKRPAEVRKQLEAYFDAGESYRVRISGSTDLEIDGFPVSDDYVGWYFTDTLVRITLPDSHGDDDVTLLANGDPLEVVDGQVSIRVAEDTDVEIAKPEAVRPSEAKGPTHLAGGPQKKSRNSTSYGFPK